MRMSHRSAITVYVLRKAEWWARRMTSEHLNDSEGPSTSSHRAERGKAPFAPHAAHQTANPVAMGSPSGVCDAVHKNQDHPPIVRLHEQLPSVGAAERVVHRHDESLGDFTAVVDVFHTSVG